MTQKPNNNDSLSDEEVAARLQQLEEEDLAGARKIGTLHTNRAHVQTWRGLTRIAFGERVTTEDFTIWTTAINMRTEYAVELAYLIIEQHEREQRIEDAYKDFDNTWMRSETGEDG